MAGVEVDGRKAGIYAHVAHFVKDHPVCGVIHGHSVTLTVRIKGPRDSMGFVADFSEVKEAMRAVLKLIDHKGLLVPDELLGREEGFDDDYKVTFDGEGNWGLLPHWQVCPMPIKDTTAESMAEWAGKELLTRIANPDRFDEVQVLYWETNSTNAVWNRGET